MPEYVFALGTLSDGSRDVSPVALSGEIQVAFPNLQFTVCMGATTVKITTDAVVDLSTIVSDHQTGGELRHLAEMKVLRKRGVDDRTHELMRVKIEAAASYAAFETAFGTSVNDGVTLKNDIDAAADMTALDAIVDTRT